ncbi:MAG: PcfJ domain-containing protein [Candidatus Krumholzibacteriia bacterium]
MGNQGKKGLTRARRAAMRKKSNEDQARTRDKKRRSLIEQKRTARNVARALGKPPATAPSRRVEEAWTLLHTHPWRELLGKRSNTRTVIQELADRRPRLLAADIMEPVLAIILISGVRSLDRWRPGGKGLRANFLSLAAHLLGPYPVPKFILEVTMQGDGLITPELFRHLRTAKALAHGGSIHRDLRGTVLPGTLTRRMCHVWAATPETLSIAGAARRAQVLCYGGGVKLARLIAGGLPRVMSHNREEFWAEAIHWFCRQPDLDPVQVGPLCDFLSHRIAEDPGFSLKGRTYGSLKRAMEQWHRETADLRRIGMKSFTPSGFAGATWRKTVKVHGRLVAEDLWSFQEILTARDLVDEGSAMRHCVATYARNIGCGYCSIWSLRMNGNRKLTIEVVNRERRVVQVRGKSNRRALEAEAVMVRKWAAKNALQVELRGL